MNDPAPPQPRFGSLRESDAQALIRDFGSPVYLYDMLGLEAWYAQFQYRIRRLYPHCTIAVSYKTNPVLGILARLHRLGAAAEVISGDEYQYARTLGIQGASVVFNGPVKREAELLQALRSGCRINCDHVDEIERIEALAESDGQPATIGLRVFRERPGNFNRFGFAFGGDGTAGAAWSAVEKIARSRWLRLGGIHAHIGTNIRDMTRFSELGNDLGQFAACLHNATGQWLDWIDVGGGLAGISPTNDEVEVAAWPLPCLDAYAHSVLDPLLPVLRQSPTPTEVIFEPGRALFDPWGGILTTVVGRRPTSQSEAAVILDAGITHLALAEKFNHPLVVCKAADESNDSRQTRFLGPTCMQRDEVHRPAKTTALQHGDHLILYGAGGYSMTMAIPFVSLRAGIVGWDEGDSFYWLRRPESLADKLALESPGLDALGVSESCNEAGGGVRS